MSETTCLCTCQWEVIRILSIGLKLKFDKSAPTIYILCDRADQKGSYASKNGSWGFEICDTFFCQFWTINYNILEGDQYEMRVEGRETQSPSKPRKQFLDTWSLFTDCVPKRMRVLFPYILAYTVAPYWDYEDKPPSPSQKKNYNWTGFDVVWIIKIIFRIHKNEDQLT